MTDQMVVTATEVQRHFKTVMQQLRKTRRHTIIQSSGTPVAVLLPIEEYEALVSQSQRQAAFREFAYHFGQEVEASGLTEEAFLAEIEETKREVVAKQYGWAI